MKERGGGKTVLSVNIVLIIILYSIMAKRFLVWEEERRAAQRNDLFGLQSKFS